MLGKFPSLTLSGKGRQEKLVRSGSLWRSFFTVCSQQNSWLHVEVSGLQLRLLAWKGFNWIASRHQDAQIPQQCVWYKNLDRRRLDSKSDRILHVISWVCLNLQQQQLIIGGSEGSSWVGYVTDTWDSSHKLPAELPLWQEAPIDAKLMETILVRSHSGVGAADIGGGRSGGEAAGWQQWQNSNEKSIKMSTGHHPKRDRNRRWCLWSSSGWLL